MKVLSTLGVKGVLDELAPRFARKAGLTLDITFNPTALLMQRIAEGERGDVALLTCEGIERLMGTGTLQAGSRVDLARSKVGLAVRAGAERPDITSAEAVKAALLAAECVVYARAGASGIFFAGLLRRLGIADAVNARATLIPAGFTGELLVDGRATIAVQQMSELMVVPGIDILGPLPPEIQDDLVFSGGIFAGPTDTGMAARFLAAISGPATLALYRAKGLYEI